MCRTIDGWGVIDGKPNMTLALADHIVAGFSNLIVLYVPTHLDVILQ